MTAWFDHLAAAIDDLDGDTATSRDRRSAAVPAWLAALLYLASLA